MGAAFNRFYQRLLLLLPFVTNLLPKDDFSYDAPNQWYTNFPECLGFKQSPIAINSNKALQIPLSPLLFYSYDDLFEEQMRAQNNGHTVEFHVPATIFGQKPLISGGLLTDFYEAESLHFHWGSPTSKGSEHVLNGRRYDLEMHIVHKNTKYVNMEMAREYQDGLAVIAVLFKAVKSPTNFYLGLSQIYSALDYLVAYNSTVITQDFITLGSLLGNINRQHFFTYKGSLTTPPCSEAVTWIVYPEVLPISHLELIKFWRLLDSSGNKLQNNVRPLQPLERRKVYLQLQLNSL